MRVSLLLTLPLALTACATDGAETESPDGINDVGIGDGKGDGAELSECQTAEVLKLLNSGATIEDLEGKGVHARASENLVTYRDGEDGTFGTEDDNTFEDLAEVDAVDFVGEVALTQLGLAVADACAATTDIYADARDVTKSFITFPVGAEAPTDYDYPDGNGFSLGGTEFWQKWSGGHNPTYSFDEGTDAGRRCMQAAAIRFETIMADAPAELIQLRDTTNWSGSFFNWNDDYSGPGAYGDASSSRLWAWRTSLIKWISQTSKDGSCYLPTRELVIKVANACLATAASNNGEIQGCQAR